MVFTASHRILYIVIPWIKQGTLGSCHIKYSIRWNPQSERKRERMREREEKAWASSILYYMWFGFWHAVFPCIHHHTFVLFECRKTAEQSKFRMIATTATATATVTKLPVYMLSILCYTLYTTQSLAHGLFINKFWTHSNQHIQYISHK